MIVVDSVSVCLLPKYTRGAEQMLVDYLIKNLKYIFHFIFLISTVVFEISIENGRVMFAGVAGF